MAGKQRPAPPQQCRRGLVARLPVPCMCVAECIWVSEIEDGQMEKASTVSNKRLSSPVDLPHPPPSSCSSHHDSLRTTLPNPFLIPHTKTELTCQHVLERASWASSSHQLKPIAHYYARLLPLRLVRLLPDRKRPRPAPAAFLPPKHLSGQNPSSS